MARTLRIAVLIGVLAALVAGTGTVVADQDHGHNQKIIRTTLIGVPNPPVTIAGVRGAGHAWDIDRGEATLRANGRLDLRVRGLVLTHTTPGSPAPEGTNPVPTGIAIVSCNGGVNPGDIVMSAPVPFSVPTGNARVRETLHLPSPCFAPTIFFGSVGGAWFAVSG